MRAKDFKQSWQRGQDLEDYFFKLVLKRDKNARRATRSEQFKHIDFVTSFGTIDVKAKKRLNRHSGTLQSERIWLEYKNVQGKDGWLVSGVDIIAFERDDDFILAHRKDIKELADKLCDITNLVTDKTDVLYNGYTRKGRQDLLTITMNDLMKLNYKLWKKE